MEFNLSTRGAPDSGTDGKNAEETSDRSSSGDHSLEGSISDLIGPFISKSGFTLYDVEFQGRVLRITIEKPGGVTVDDCVEVSRLVNPMLDVDDVIPGGRYELEVSSPGLNRALRKPEHFAAAVGSRIHVTTYDAMAQWNKSAFFDKRRNFTASLKAFDGVNLSLEDAEHVVTIPLKAISKSRMEFELKTTPPPGSERARQEKKSRQK